MKIVIEAANIKGLMYNCNESEMSLNGFVFADYDDFTNLGNLRYNGTLCRITIEPLEEQTNER